MSIYTPQSNEIEFLNDRDTVVTNSRFIVNNQIYVINGITSVKQSLISADKKPDIGIMILGIFVLLLSFGMREASEIFAFFMLIFSLLIIALSFWIKSKNKDIAIVVLQTSSGEVQALSSDDIDFISSVVFALNQAIIHRG